MPQTHSIKGSILAANSKTGIPGLKIEAWEQDVKQPDLLGQVVTNEHGQFRFTFHESQWKDNYKDQNPIVYFRVYDAKGKLLRDTRGELYWTAKQGTKEIIIPVEATTELTQMTMEKKIKTSNTVLGKITDVNGRPLANLKVAIYDVDMREWQVLADTFTNKEGKYELTWTHEQLSGRGRKTADIAIKVFTKEQETELYRSSMNEVRFNASDREEINIMVRQTLPQEVVEFDFLVKEVSFLAGKVAIADLQESGEHRDVTFLSKELGVPARKIEHLAVAHRLENLSNINAAFFYALFHKDTLLHNDFTKNLHARISIGIGEDDQTLLYDVALADSKRIEVDIQDAVAEKIVLSAILKNIKQNLEILSKYRKKGDEYYKNEHSQKVIHFFGSFFKEGKLKEVQKLFNENKNDLNEFFDKVVDPSFYATKEKEKDAKVNFEMGKLLGFGNDIIPQIINSRGIKKPEDVKKLAKLNTADWEKEITSARSDIKDKKLTHTYASAIVRKLEKEYPTLAFAAQLERDEKAQRKVLKNQDKIVSFFNKHEDFEFLKHNVDLYLKEKKVKNENAEEIREELKSVQRVFRLVPHYGKTLALRNEKIHSAQSIVATGKTRFVKEIAPKAGIEEKEAREIYSRAESKHTAAILMVGDLQDSMSVVDIASFETTMLAEKLETVSKDFPNLKSLFKLTDTCECEHCRSVYSPAAYLVEILQFLEKRMVVANNAKSVLFQRRPDLGEIDLSCANANTPVKYIDLVCEILEEAVAPDPGINFSGVLTDGTDALKGKISNALLEKLTAAGLHITSEALIFETVSSTTKPHYLRDKGLVCKIVNTGGSNYAVYPLRQTFGRAEELDAAPEYINVNAYDTLKNSSFAFNLPFDLQHTEAKAYLSRFEISRADLMKAFQSAMDPDHESVASERLGLTDTERKIIASTPAPNSNTSQQAYWNVPAPGNVVDYLKQVDHFLDKTGLTYKELSLLLKLKFINKNGNLFVKHNDLSCNTEQKEIAHLDLDALDRIHRFLRLQKKTGWKFEVLNAIISHKKLGDCKLDDACLVKAAQLKEIEEKASITIEELIGCFGEMPYSILQEDGLKPLYHQVFLNKAKNGTIDEGLLPEKVDGSQLLTMYIDYIATCLQLKQKDLEFITPLLPDNNLTFSNLSHLFAASVLIKKLKLKAEDFAIIKILSGINIFDSPEKTLEFLEVVENFKHSPLKATDVQFILNHEATNPSDREIKVSKVEGVLDNLKTGYEKINKEQRSKFDDNLSAKEQRETLIGVLSGLEGIVEEDVKTIVKFIDRDWTDAAAAKIFLDRKLDERIDKTGINAAIDTLDAVAAGIDSSNEQKDLVKELLDSIAGFQIQKTKQTFLEQTLSTAFKVDLALTGIVLKYAKLKQPALGTDLIATLLMDILDNSITPANYPKQYASIKLLHKMFALLNAFKLSNTDVEWYFKNNANPALSWFEFDSIPHATGQTAVDFAKYSAFCEIVIYSKQFTAVANPLDAEKPVSFFSAAELILSGAAGSDEFLNTLTLLTGYEISDLDAIDTHLFAAFDLANYNDIKNWKRLLECAEFSRKLGAQTRQIKEYIKPTLFASEVNDLRATLKSRYDENTWLSTLKEIMDTIRPQKRDALVAYLLATNPKIKDENDLYEYFLVDVEMGSCMPSSRIVQAHNSIQLFVQRCLMGLEPDAVADVERDPSWNQWKWMKNYRVWEANRKVFLYPENWYDVTLTDDKTYLLTEFINEIHQNDLTNDTAEEALKKYLEKLDNIAFLEVMATWYDVPTRNMHVFARTKGGDPSMYYYRRFENERYWSPWEKVELDITGDHLLAFIRNNRLYLAWPIFSEETQPNQGAKLPDTSNRNEQPVDKPRKKMKIQLAISEYTNKKWQPKKVSKDSILTPNNYVISEANFFRRDVYNLVYSQVTDQVMLFTSPRSEKAFICLNGVFDITGCKGYPELVFEGENYFPDFYPDFKDTELKSQRYNKQIPVSSRSLAVQNSRSPFSFYEILGNTSEGFRISYPHQFTTIDMIGLFYQFFQLIIHTGVTKNKRNQFKIPLGTLLPYFKEDSNRAYVIIPGFYKKTIGDKKDFTLNDSEKRTVSNVFQLLDDIANWYKKILAEFQGTPPTNAQAAVQIIFTDPGFQNILKELSKYADLDIFLNLLVGISGDPKVDEFLTELIKDEPLKYGEQFKNMYHPLVCALRSTLYKDGIPALMKRETQLQKTNFDFNSYYNPNAQFVPQTFIKNSEGSKTLSYPIEDIDFNNEGSYSAYNWDLFFRVPLHIAGSLTKNQRFEDALTWFHYMFNPTGALPGSGAQKYWVTKPFFLNQEVDYQSQRIDTLMYATSGSNHSNISDTTNNEIIKDLEFAISEWRTKPFRPDVIARFRPVAYQKALLMKYIDNLAEWGDYLFRQDTMESIAQATQMYILADKLLGPKPKIIPAAIKQPYETYNQIEAKLDSFGNALVELENILPDLSVLPEGGAELPAPPVTLSMLYFCIPANEKMFEYWDRIADRLFKIRHCQNIDGIERSLALFAPPIDPGMLVRAAASGLNLSSVIAGLNVPTPYYRFNVLSQKATELAQEVRGLGNSLLVALEKKDVEGLTLLRSELELKVLNAVKDIKKLQINESKEQIEVLKKTKKVTEERQKYYRNIQKIISKEQLSLDLLEFAQREQVSAQNINILASVLGYLPNVTIGASGFGGSPHVNAQWGTGNIISALQAAAGTHNLMASMMTYQANRASTLGSYDRRLDDWKFQERLATKELASIDKQIAAAEIRKDIAEADLKNHELQIENSQKADEFMRSKFTNKELYDWMIGQISGVYFKSYQLAHDFAKKAERCYRFELGNDDSFISYGYWDSMKKGLQSADHLIHDIKRMETSYLDKNRREYEMIKHVSLTQLDPLALLRLRATGKCDFEIPEVLYDLDHPGQYFRRLKSVSISIPCIAGPYTSVSAKLSLVNNRYRKNTNDPNNYAEVLGNDDRFVYNIGAIQSIATSHAQNDSGMFELNFRDERYLPFENTGAISSWRLELPKKIKQFDYNTISDVIVHVKYTAREGGNSLQEAVSNGLEIQLQEIKQEISQNGLHLAINMKQDMPNEWHLLKKNGKVSLKVEKSRLPYIAQEARIESVMFVPKIAGKDNTGELPIDLMIKEKDKKDFKIKNISKLDDMISGKHADIELDQSFILSVSEDDKLKLEELLLVVNYKL
jgi:5-hydroxyisourate hydrolase-like protein (transthyretin family)